MNDGPIFLAGVSSSGKTLLRLALTSNPRIAISRRTYMWTRFYNRFGDLGRYDNFERCLAAMLAHKPMRALRPDPDRIRSEFRKGDPTYARLFALFHQHYAERLGRPRWGDQLGFVEHYADVILTAYPAAKMIQMVRDPRDRYGESAVVSRRQVGAAGPAAAKWVASAALAERNQQRYPDRYRVVRCEALVSRFEETLRDICTFLDEEFVPGMLTMEAALRFGEDDDEPHGEVSFPAVLRVPTDGARAAVLNREVAFIQAYARRNMAILGYEPRSIPLSLPERVLLYAVDWPVNLAGVLAWRVLAARQLG